MLRKLGDELINYSRKNPILFIFFVYHVCFYFDRFPTAP